jgi:TPR repeat protein
VPNDIVRLPDIRYGRARYQPGGVTVRNRKAIILRALVTSSVLATSAGLAMAEPVLSEQRSVSNSKFGADTQIKSLLKKLYTLLGQDQINSAESVELLMSVSDLLPNASATGQQLMREFPEQLRARAKELRDGGSLATSINYEAFAEVAALYAKSSDRPSDLATEVSATTTREPAPLPDASVTVSSFSAPPALPAAVQRTLLERGDAMLQQRDVAAARMLFTRAANAGAGVAALKLANTYDPGFIRDHNLIGIKGDPQEAEAWYRKAAALGEKEAEQRLKSLKGQRKTVATQ